MSKQAEAKSGTHKPAHTTGGAQLERPDRTRLPAEEALDMALEGTFPASDPVSITTAR